MILETANEVIQLSRSKIQGNFVYILGRGGHLQACLLNTVITQVFHGCLMRGQLEKTAKILG